MRIDLPCCDFEYCRYCLDGNCKDEKKYAKCNYRYLKDKDDKDKESEAKDGFFEHRTQGYIK